MTKSREGEQGLFLIFDEVAALHQLDEMVLPSRNDGEESHLALPAHPLLQAAEGPSPVDSHHDPGDESTLLEQPVFDPRIRFF